MVICFLLAWILANIGMQGWDESKPVLGWRKVLQRGIGVLGRASMYFIGFRKGMKDLGKKYGQNCTIFWSHFDSKLDLTYKFIFLPLSFVFIIFNLFPFSDNSWHSMYQRRSSYPCCGSPLLFLWCHRHLLCRLPLLHQQTGEPQHPPLGQVYEVQTVNICQQRGSRQ